MRTLVTTHREEADLHVAREIADLIRERSARGERTVLGLATGHTPIQTYRELIRMHRLAGLDFSMVETFNLDDYIGLPKDHEASFYRFMREHLFDHVNIPADRIHFPDGSDASRDFDAFAGAYEEEIRAAGGIDLQILGVGLNGHVAFNEPGSAPDSRTRVIELSAKDPGDERQGLRRSVRDAGPRTYDGNRHHSRGAAGPHSGFRCAQGRDRSAHPEGICER